MNILITNIGRRNYLVKFIKQTRNFSGNVFVSDCDKTASGLYGDCDDFFILPKPVDDEKTYVKKLKELCLNKGINIVIPIIDPEIYILSKYKDEFKNNNILLLVSDKEVLDICYDKLEMNNFLKKNDLPYAKIYKNIKDFDMDFDKNLIEFPVFIKPVYGSGSRDSSKIYNYQSLKSNLKNNMIIQEYIEGEEYGVDVFNGRNNKPARIIIKKKLGMRSGETDKAVTIHNKKIQSIVKKLAINLKHFGPLDCDILKAKSEFYIIDLNPRFGGGYPSTHMAGVNFLELVIKLYENKKIKQEYNNYEINQITMKDIGLKTTKINDKYLFGIGDKDG